MVTARCLCEKIEVSLEEDPKSFVVCHCVSCRKWTGGVFMSVYGGKALKFKNEELLGHYSSSDWAERGFCTCCGSNIYFKMKKSGSYFLMLGLFGDSISPAFSAQQYIDEKPSNYCFSNETRDVTKKEMEAKLDKYLANTLD